MAASQGILRVHQQERTLTFQLDGCATMHHSLPLRQLALEALADGSTSLRVDLRRCVHMDSTFLGTLLFLKRALEKRPHGEFALVCPSPQCQNLLRGMALDDYYPVVTVPEPPDGEWVELSSSEADPTSFQCNVVQAHQELANLGGRAGAPFQAVAECLARELEAEQTRKGQEGGR